jgi:protein-disulfide isomerase
MSQSKRELREQRKAARVAAEQAEAAKNVRRRRAWWLSGAVAVAAVVVAVAAAVSSSGAPKPVHTSAVVAGVPETKGVLGDPKAPVTITEYLDPQCPVCGAASRR